MKNKKILYIALAAIAVVLVAVLVFVFAGCNNGTTNNGGTTAGNQTVEPTYKSSLELLNEVFTSYNASATEDTMLYVGGGNPYNFETVNPEGPATFVALADTDYDENLGFPATEVSKIENAASMFNMMNTNTFNCYTVKLTSGTDVNAMANTIKENVLDRDWICGMPEKLVIINCPGNYLLVVWGVVEFGGIVDPVVDSVIANIEGSSIVVSTPVTR